MENQEIEVKKTLFERDKNLKGKLIVGGTIYFESKTDKNGKVYYTAHVESATQHFRLFLRSVKNKELLVANVEPYVFK
jgi:hypothetical protein